MSAKGTFEFIPASLGVKSTDSVTVIKQRLNERYGLAVDEQHIFDVFGELADKSLADLHVVPEQKLSLSHECDKRTPNGIRCMLVGDPAVGKKGLIDAFRNSFDPTYKATPFYCSAGPIHYEDITVSLHLRKHPGQLEHNECISSFFHKVDVFVIVFSVSEPSSLEHVEHWNKLIHKHGASKAPVLLVGTKCDLRKDAKLLAAMRGKGIAMVPHSAMEAVAKQIDAYGLYECSAKSKEGLPNFLASIVAAEKAKVHKKSILSRILGKSDKHSADVTSAASTTLTNSITTPSTTTATVHYSAPLRTVPQTTASTIANSGPKRSSATTSKDKTASIAPKTAVTPCKTSATATTMSADDTTSKTEKSISRSIFRFRNRSSSRGSRSPRSRTARSRSKTSTSRSTTRDSLSTSSAPAEERSRSVSARRPPPPPVLAISTTLAHRRSSAPSIVVGHGATRSIPPPPPSLASLSIPTTSARRSVTPSGTSSNRNKPSPRTRSHSTSRAAPPLPTVATSTRAPSTGRARSQSDTAPRAAHSPAPPPSLKAQPPAPLEPPGGDTMAALKDGSVEFWSSELRGVVDDDDISEVAARLAAAGFKKKHAHDFSRDDLKDAGLNSGVIKDLLSKQHAPASFPGLGSGVPQPLQPSMLPAHLQRISEESLKLLEIIGEGTFSVVWKATWTRALSVGSMQNEQITVAVKMSKSVKEGFSPEMIREVAVMAGLPHQNILSLLGVCESHQPKLVYELMTTDLFKLIASGHMTRHFQLRALRDVAAGVCHLHAHGIVHRDLKPGNVLIRDDQVKICDFGSSKDLKHTAQKMSVAGTLDYMSPEMIAKKPVGKPADVWAFGVLVFECLVGKVPSSTDLPRLVAELKQAQCLPQLIDIFAQCHVRVPEKRPTMTIVYQHLQKLLIQDAQDSQRLKEELRVAEAQDLETYRAVWTEYAYQSHISQLLSRAKDLASSKSHAVSQPSVVSSLASLIALANAGGMRLHDRMREVVESNGGTYTLAQRKSEHRTRQKVEQEYAGKFCKLLDLERATGGFDESEAFLNCLQQLAANKKNLLLVRVKDRLNNPLSSGYRDILLNVCDPQSGFIGELQLNFNKIAQIKSQTHRFYEMTRVLVLGA